MEPSNPLYDRYASREMTAIFAPRHRYLTWRRLWVTLARCQAELGLPISGEQLAALERVEGEIDFDRVAELERATRHDVVAHLRHFAELAGEAGGVLHLGATSAFLTDNADVLLQREGLVLLEGRLGALVGGLADFAERWADLPCLAYTHFQPAQLTTVGKRACLWIQDALIDLDEVEHRRGALRCRGVKGTTGTQASFLTLFDGDDGKVAELDRRLAARLGFAGSFPVTGQTYTRKQDSQVLAALAGIGESAHKLGTDLRLLQGVGELAEPFDEAQVGSSAMAYKRNPVRAERMCGLARRLITDAQNGPLNAATQWLERSLDDSSNRRLVIPDAFLTADAVVNLAAHIAQGLRVREATVRRRVRQELPFMATESWLMAASLRGGDRQELHERLRRHSLQAQEAVERGEENPLVPLVAGDAGFGLSAAEMEAALEPARFTGRAAAQTREFLAAVVRLRLARLAPASVEAPRI
ncbi:MAG TPA: adenylosuccinate lyase [Thermoanaerobaculia bacterium]|jgi:adenylosuccinate lyase|nr:adenylosuccinate lyase [Thermoanaerobaculia bacterium]